MRYEVWVGSGPEVPVHCSAEQIQAVKRSAGGARRYPPRAAVLGVDCSYPSAQACCPPGALANRTPSQRPPRATPALAPLSDPDTPTFFQENPAQRWGSEGAA